MIALIMAGGSGTRFWPLSRKSRPKQFLRISAEKSMLQLTVDRLLPMMPISDVYIVTTDDQIQLVREHLPDLPPENIIIEPFGMNTAACIALSTAWLKRIYSPDTTMIVLPADHVIRDTDVFLHSLQAADQAAQTGRLITFGIIPTYPATGYGYIEAGDELSRGLREVTRFKEKPDKATAEAFIASGRFFWNSGMFCWRIDAIDRAFATHLPEMHSLMDTISDVWNEQGGDSDISQIYSRMPRLPIDIGIMERADHRGMIPVDYGWSDVGSWKALADISPGDESGNTAQAEYYALDAAGNFLHTSKYTAILGIDNLCVIETPDALLICTKDRSEDVKYVVEELKNRKKEELL
ncbi:MAG TPA: mannose-1-phosphate guanylyltransferase [Candidatus Cloacimonadota bacterium]|nr:mannose-1-phosphate guanylyltransferase [Candidatus Cloacimonadota bacterium]